jgi:AraC-like DNA-binding protein
MPAGLSHAMSVGPPAVFLSLYVAPAAGPAGERWSRSHALEVDTLTTELVARLARQDLDDHHRGRCAALLTDLLEQTPVSGTSLPMPRDERAARVAAALLDDPADPRELADWADELGVSTRTLSRAFRAGTSLTFGDWRTRARVAASLTALREGESVSALGERVGYASASSFIAAFRAVVGTTPGEYARRHRG